MKKSLIIGISNYDFLPCLDFSKNDAIAIFDILNKNQYQLSDWNKLIGKIAYNEMRDRIVDYFSDLTIDPQDTLIFYFSGHGLVDADGDVYLSSSETDPDNPIKRGLSFRELTTIINKCKSKIIIIILDCCYSGAATFSNSEANDKANIATTRIKKEFSIYNSREGKCLLAACQSYDYAWSLDGEYSLFTSNLIKGLKGDETSVDSNGNVTVKSLGNYLYNNVVREIKVNQKPIITFDGSGNIVIVSYPELAKKQEKSLRTAGLIDQINKNMNNKDYTKAIQQLDQVIDIDPNYGRAYFLKGLIYKIQHDYDKSLNFFNISLQKDYSNDEAWYEKGILLANEYFKNYDDAIECFDKAMEFNPKHEDALNEKRRTIEKKELINNVSHKDTNYDQNPIINIIDIRCSKDENRKVHIIFNVSGIRHGSKDTNYTINVKDWDGNMFLTHNGKIVKEAPNPAQECITYTLPLPKGSYNITFKMNNIVVNKKFETLDC